MIDAARRAPLVLVGAVFAAYLNSFPGAFQLDDYLVIVDNPRVQSWAAWLADLGSIRPLLKLTYTLNWTSGLGLFGFHLVNVGLHAANSVLVYYLFTNFGGPRSQNPSNEPRPFLGPALIGALIFALHPVQTEAVTYVSGRSMSLMALFYLGSLVTYVHGWRERSWPLLYVVSPVCFGLALLTKEVAVSLPLALLLWEASEGRVLARWREVFRRQVVHWIILGCILIALVLHRQYWELLTLSFREQSLYTVLLTQINGITYLISRLGRVHGLNIDPDLPLLSAWTPALVVEAILLVMVLVVAAIAWRRRPWWGFGVAWFFIHVLPTNSLVLRLDVANERQLYLAGCGIFFAIGKEIEALTVAWPTHPRNIRGAVMLLVLTLGAFATVRNRDYRDEITLWEATARTSPRKARVHNNLGAAYAMAGRHEDARRCYLTALRLDPDFSLARDNLALLDVGSRDDSSDGSRTRLEP